MGKKRVPPAPEVTPGERLRRRNPYREAGNLEERARRLMTMSGSMMGEAMRLFAQAAVIREQAGGDVDGVD